MLSLDGFLKIGESILGKAVKNTMEAVGSIYTTKEMKSFEKKINNIMQTKREKTYSSGEYYVNNAELFSEQYYVKGLIASARLNAVYEMARKYRLGTLEGQVLLEDTINSGMLEEFIRNVEKDLKLDKGFLNKSVLNFAKTDKILKDLKKEYNTRGLPILFESYMMGVQRGVIFLKKIYEEFKIIIANEACKLNLLDHFEEEVKQVRLKSLKEKNIKKIRKYTIFRNAEKSFKKVLGEVDLNYNKDSLGTLNQLLLNYVKEKNGRINEYVSSLIDRKGEDYLSLNSENPDWRNVKVLSFKKKIDEELRVPTDFVRVELYKKLIKDNAPKWVDYYTKIVNTDELPASVTVNGLKKFFQTDKLNYYALSKLENMGLITRQKRGEYTLNKMRSEDEVVVRELTNLIEDLKESGF